jgi:hypothetical protein
MPHVSYAVQIFWNSMNSILAVDPTSGQIYRMRHGLYPNFAEFDAYNDLEMLFLTITWLSYNLLQVTRRKSNRGAWIY